MLSDETTVGKFPIQAVEVLHDSIKDVEKDYPYHKDFKPENSADAVAKAAVQLASNLKKEALVAFTTTGYSAKVLSRYRPKENIYAISHSLKTHRRLNLLWGVRPLFVMEDQDNPSKLLHDFIKKLLDEKRIDINKRFVVTMGDVGGKSSSTNLIRLLDKDGMEAVLGYKF
jgi:pyruvate kinase